MLPPVCREARRLMDAADDAAGRIMRTEAEIIRTLKYLREHGAVSEAHGLRTMVDRLVRAEADRDAAKAAQDALEMTPGEILAAGDRRHQPD